MKLIAHLLPENFGEVDVAEIDQLRSEFMHYSHLLLMLRNKINEKYADLYIGYGQGTFHTEPSPQYPLVTEMTRTPKVMVPNIVAKWQIEDAQNGKQHPNVLVYQPHTLFTAANRRYCWVDTPQTRHMVSAINTLVKRYNQTANALAITIVQIKQIANPS